MTETEDDDEASLISEDGWAGDAPKREVLDLVWAAIHRKQEKRDTYEIGQCNLLIYENSRPGFVVNTRRLFQMLRTAPRFEVRSSHGFDVVSVITGSHVLHDLFGQPRIIAVPSTVRAEPA